MQGVYLVGMAKPGTVDHFRKWASELELDNEERWEIEPFQAEIIKDIFAGFSEVWAVLPEGNGKTTLLAGIALYHGDAEGWNRKTCFVPIGASSREQAWIMYRQAEGFVDRNPNMQERFKCQEGYKRIKCLSVAGRIQVYAADEKTGDGVIPTLAILDELHRQRDLRLYRTWRGKLKKRGGQLITISTAGVPESDFEETRGRIIKQAKKLDRKGPHWRAEGDSVVLHDWAVRDRKQANNLKVVAAANPRKSITPASLREERDSATSSEAHWLRMVCNIAARISGQAVFPEEWDALYEKNLAAESGSWCIGGLDLGWKLDTTAMVILAWEARERRVLTGIRILEPPVDEADIVQGLVYLQTEFQPVGWVYDPNAGGAQMAQLLMKGEHPAQNGVEFEFIEHSQDNSPMALAATRFEEAVRMHWFKHDGHKTLRRHVLNAVRRDLGGEKWKYDRPPEARGEARKRFPIDALTAMLFANSVAVAEKDQPSPEPLVAVVSR